MRILITGVTGFVGRHLAAGLRARGDEVIGLSRSGRWPEDGFPLSDPVPLRACDPQDARAIENILQEVAPDQVYHLAGYAHVGRSFKEPEAAWEGNLTATRRLYEAILHAGARPRVLYAGSGMVYGDAERPGQSFDEASPLRPTSPYSASKAAADLLGYQVWSTEGLPVIRSRPYNHTGPGQSPEYAVPAFARQVAAISLGRQPPVLETGNLSPRRDLTDVRDMVRAYLLLMEKGTPGEAYNIGSGRTWSMREVVDRLIEAAGVHAEIRQRADLVRTKEVATLEVNASRLRRDTGWSPIYSMEQTLGDTLEYWRGALAGRV
jgi:GDP-4-dehydro-6-deoxy-D-mannose reductase